MTSNPTATAAAAAPEEKFALTSSRHFPDWLARTGASLAFTTYQAGKLFLIGLKPDGRLAVFERTFARCMGLGVSPDARTLMLATQYQLLRFDNVVPQGGAHGEHDAVFVPHVAWITGDVDAHDVGDPAGRTSGVRQHAVLLPRHGERRLQLQAAVAAAVHQQARARGSLPPQRHGDGGRQAALCHAGRRFRRGRRLARPARRRRHGHRRHDRRDVLRGLSMPHSPRLHDGRLWLLNSGTGEFGFLDRDAKKFEAVAFCPGYARGLAFVGAYAIVGLSLARENRTFQGLPLDAALAARGAEPRCGLLVIDIKTGDTVEWLRIEGVVRELFDVAVLPGVRNPAAIGFKTDEIQRVISIDET